jgi:hypothetical protein
MRILAYAVAGAVCALGIYALPSTPANAMPVDNAVTTAADSNAQLTASRRKARRAGVGGSIRRDLGGRGPGGGLPLGRGTATSPGGVPTEGRGGMGR